PAAAYFTIFIGPNAPKCFVLPRPRPVFPHLEAQRGSCVPEPLLRSKAAQAVSTRPTKGATVARLRHRAPAVQHRAPSERGRLVHIPHQLLETNREAAALVLCEKPAHLAGATVRLQNESAGM